MAGWIGPLAAFWWVLATLVLVASVVGAGVRRRKPARPEPPITDFSVIAPMVGVGDATPQYVECLRDLAAAGAEVLICVESADDPACSAVRNIWPEATILAGVSDVSFNPKVNNIAKGLAAFQHALCAVCDSGSLIRVADLRAMGAELGDGVGLVEALKPPSQPENWAAELECAILNGHQARWLICADRLGIKGACGGVLLLSRETLDRIGGAAGFSVEIAEDHALLTSVRALGLTSRISDVTPVYPRPHRNWTDVWMRQVRWARLRRLLSPLSMLLEAAFGFLAALAAACLAAPWIAAGMGFPAADPLLAGLLAALLHGAVWIAAERIFLAARGWHWSARHALAILLRETLLPVMVLHSLTGNAIEWRGIDVVGGWRRHRARAMASRGGNGS